MAVETKTSILFWPHFRRGRSLQFIVTIFLLLIGQKARNSRCDWFVQLFDNSILISDIVPINKFLLSHQGKPGVLDEPIRLEEFCNCITKPGILITLVFSFTCSLVRKQ